MPNPYTIVKNSVQRKPSVLDHREHLQDSQNQLNNAVKHPKDY